MKENILFVIAMIWAVMVGALVWWATSFMAQTKPLPAQPSIPQAPKEKTHPPCRAPFEIQTSFARKAITDMPEDYKCGVSSDSLLVDINGRCWINPYGCLDSDNEALKIRRDIDGRWHAEVKGLKFFLRAIDTQGLIPAASVRVVK